MIGFLSCDHQIPMSQCNNRGLSWLCFSNEEDPGVCRLMQFEGRCTTTGTGTMTVAQVWYAAIMPVHTYVLYVRMYLRCEISSLY